MIGLTENHEKVIERGAFFKNILQMEKEENAFLYNYTNN